MLLNAVFSLHIKGCHFFEMRHVHIYFLPRLKFNCFFAKHKATILKNISEVRKSICQQVGDKYIEYDPVIIMIDLMLLHKEAYRHILYNSSFQNHWKLAVVLLLVEAYAEWMTTQGKMNSEASNPSSPHWFEGEETFYFACIYSILGCGMFLSVVVMVTSAWWSLFPSHRPHSYTFLALWKGLVLGSFCRFLFIPSMIWGQVGSWHHVFITGYTLLSQQKAYSVVCDLSAVASAIVIILGIAVKDLYTHHITSTILAMAYSCLCRDTSYSNSSSVYCL